jgi:hypothetical protein
MRSKLLVKQCDYTKNLDLSRVLNTLLNRLTSKSTITLQLLVIRILHCHSGNYLSYLPRIYNNICAILCILQTYWWGRQERNDNNYTHTHSHTHTHTYIYIAYTQCSILCFHYKDQSVNRGREISQYVHSELHYIYPDRFFSPPHTFQVSSAWSWPFRSIVVPKLRIHGAIRPLPM